MFFDFPLDQLRAYLPPRNEPENFSDFWHQTLKEAQSHPLSPQFVRVDYGMETVETYDVTFNGYGGDPVKGWFLLPAHRSGRLPCVVEYIGYGGGRGFPTGWLLWSSAGYAHLVMDTRGQGSVWSPGDTPDREPEGSNPQYPGFLTRGITRPESYYYRRVFTDGYRAVETALSHPAVDPQRIAVAGGSQGGGIALAVSGLSTDVQVLLSDVPFLCHYRRATEIVDTEPYVELSNYLKTHRNQVEQVFRTLSYFDGLNFAARAKANALFSVGLMDEICPPSTVFAAYNHYAGPKDMRVWEYNHHEAYDSFQVVEKVRFLKQLWG